VDDFMAQSAYEADEPLQARMRLRKLNMLTENEYFPRYCLRAKEMPQECFLDEENRRLHLYYLSAEDEIAKSRHQDRTRLLEGSIAAYQYAWEFFQLQTMRHIIGMLNAKNITGREVDLRIAEAILKLIPIDQESLPAIMLYRQSLEMHMRPDEPGILESFLAKLHHYADKLLISDARYLFRSALNFCLLRGNKGEEGTNYASLEIYKEMDKRDLFLVEGCIPATLFKELVTQGILCKDFEWTDRVIQKYESLVAGDPDKTTANFNRGFLHYCKQEYVEAQRCLHRVLDHYDDVFFGFDARILLLRIYYETQSFQAMDSFIDSFKMYVKRNKRVGKSKIELGLNAAKLFRKLVHVKPWDLTALEKLEAEVSSTPVNPSSKSWFLDQTMLLLSKARSLPNSRVKHRR
jgi:tetratricopeptide (TPR) repeat protein